MKEIEIIIEELNDSGIHVYLENSKLKTQSAKGALTPELIKLIKNHKKSIIKRLETEYENNTGIDISEANIEKAPLSNGHITASYAQQRLWFIDQMEGGSSHYNIPFVMQINGDFDLKIAESTFIDLIIRHATLRTNFINKNNELLQIIHEDFEFKIKQVSLSHLKDVDQQNKIKELIKYDVEEAFNLNHGLMIRASYLSTSNDQGILLLNIHHIATDGWSMQLFIKEFNQIYQALLTNNPTSLMSLPVDYADYSHWQQEYIKKETLVSQLSYWREQLDSIPGLHSLPIDFERPKFQTYNGALYQFELENDTINKLKKLALENNATFFMMIHAAFAILLSRYSYFEDIVIGTPVANRQKPEFESIVGHFVNTIVLRVNCSNNPTFKEFLEQIKAVNLDAQTNQDVPIEILIDELNIERGTDHNALFQIMLSVNNNEEIDFKIANADVLVEFNKETKSKFELTLHVTESKKTLCAFEYNTDLFKPGTIQNFASVFKSLLKSIISNPNKNISELSLVSQSEINSVFKAIKKNNDMSSGMPCVHEIFENQVNATPDEIAVFFKNQTLTYAELNAKSNFLAHYLIDFAEGKHIRIGLCLERSMDLLIAVLATLKSGNSYVALEPSYPQDRLRYLSKDSELSLILMSETSSKKFVDLGVQYLILSESVMKEKISLEYDSHNPQTNISPENEVYTLFTSGSTGKPKGVIIPHRGLSNYIDYACKAYFKGSISGSVVSSPLCFDATLTTLLTPLICGSGVELLSESDSDIELIHNRIFNSKSPLLFKVTPSHLEALFHFNVDAFTDVAHMFVVGGEKFPINLLKKWKLSKTPSTTFVNEYGPTETVVGCSTFFLDDVKKINEIYQTSVPIGKAIQNTQLIVLNDHMMLQPTGAIGELYIGGSGVAHGYLNKNKLTSESFIEHNLFAKEINSRLYKTGDLVRYLENDNLEFIGRKDNQIKLRGYRIELGEVEQHILDHVDVNSVAIVFDQETLDTEHLIAYFTSKSKEEDSILVDKVKQSIQDRLPNYMVPTFFKRIDNIPLTTNGKVNKKELPEYKYLSKKNQVIEAKNETEKTLVKIWSELLNIVEENLSIQSNFFELGGDSILSIQVASRASAVGLKLTVKQIFDHQTIESLAPHVVLSDLTLPQEAVTGGMPLLPIQHRFFVNHKGLHHYNQSVLLQTPDGFSFDLLKRFVEKLYERHDALRLSFQSKKSEWVANHFDFHQQMVTDSLDQIKLDQVGFDGLEVSADKYQASLNLEQGQLFRAIHYSDQNNESRILLILHHLIVDGVSWRVILEDFELLFEQYMTLKPLELAPKTLSYQAWGNFLIEYASSDSLVNEVEYWKQVLSTPLPDFFQIIDDKTLNKISKSEQSQNGFSSLKLEVNKKLTSQLLSAAQSAYNTQINELLLSALLLGFYRWCGTDHLRVDLESHGREELDAKINLNQTVGWFTTLFPVVLSSDSMDIKSVICAVKEQHRAIPNQGIGYGVLKYLTEAQDITGTEESPVLFNYLGQFFNNDIVDKAFLFADEGMGAQIDPHRKPEHGLNFNGMVIEGLLSYTLDYDQSIYSAENMSDLCLQIKQAITDVVEHCVDIDERCFTPSDFPLSSISQEQLNQWQKHYLIEDIYPATPMQEGLLYHSSLNKSAYVTQLMFTLEAGVNMVLFQQAWQKLLDRHTILRTIFVTSDSGEMQQLVVKDMELSCKELDISHLSQSQQKEQVEITYDHERQTGFQLDQGPLLRLNIWYLGEQTYRVLLSFHHALLDGWSMPLVFSEVLEMYDGQVQNRSVELPSLIPYRNYISWLRAQDVNKAIEFWRTEFSDFQETSFIAANVLDTCDNEHQHDLILSHELTNKLQSVARNCHVTVNSLLQASWAYLLSRYCDQKSVVFGTTVSGRPPDLDGVEQMVGLFINTLPIKVDITFSQPFNQWVQTVHENHIKRNEFSHLPLVEIQKLVTENNEQMFDNLFVFQNYPFDENTFRHEANIELSDYVAIEKTNYSLTITATLKDVLTLHFNGKSNHFQDETLKNLTQHFKTILSSIAENPEIKVSKIPMLSSEEKYFLFNEFNDTKVNYPSGRCAHHFFEQQAEKIPDNIVLRNKADSLTYSELNKHANQLAHYLIEKGVACDEVVGVCFNRSFEMIISMLAILKAGGAYLPIDPSSPANRIEHMLTDSDLNIVLTRQDLKDTFSSKDQILLDDPIFINKLSSRPIFNPIVSGLNSKHLAYVIYTSGSTGLPKGVMIEHKSLINFCQWHIEAFKVTEKCNMAHLANVSFDASAWEIWPSILSGSRVQIISDETRLSASELLKEFKEYDVSHCFLTTALFESSFELFEDEHRHNLKYILAGGEKLTKSSFLNANTQLINVYGPTETTIATTFYPVEPELTGMPPIGKPIANTKAFVLAKDMTLTPVNCVGELYIGGTGLARDYMNQPELSAQKFIDHEFDDGVVERLYRTGDLVKCRYDGNLEFVGRIDHQIKLRGFRIELGEIESQLSLIDEVSESVVLVKESRGGEKKLIAYFTSSSLIETLKLNEQIRQALKRFLPDYMMPSHFMRLDRMPLNPNGKIDRKALPEPEIEGLGENYTPPESEIESQLVNIWSELLNLNKNEISTSANFFELGGHSLSVMKLLVKINYQFNLELTVDILFESQDLSKLASYIEMLLTHESNELIQNTDSEQNDTEHFEI